VYRVATVAAFGAWLLAWTLRRGTLPPSPGAGPRPAPAEREPEPVLAGH
jgi:hypothetical protein